MQAGSLNFAHLIASVVLNTDQRVVGQLLCVLQHQNFLETQILLIFQRLWHAFLPQMPQMFISKFPEHIPMRYWSFPKCTENLAQYHLLKIIHYKWMYSMYFPDSGNPRLEIFCRPNMQPNEAQNQPPLHCESIGMINSFFDQIPISHSALQSRNSMNASFQQEL